MTLWLASGSPRRRDLLSWAGVDLHVCPTNVDESQRSGTTPSQHALELAVRKARAADAPPGQLVLGGDTVVHRAGMLYEKPAGRADAIRMLTQLSARWHEVTTGVCVLRGAEERAWQVTTRVRFRALSDDEIRAYVATGEADDKAGAYGIQGRAGSFVAELVGSYTNVVGLPLESTLVALQAMSG